MTELAPGSDARGERASRLSLLGHDLRAAMSDIIGALRLIDQSGLDPATRLQLERIRAAGEGMALLLEEGLSLLPGEDGSTDVHPTNIRFARLLYDLDMRWSGRAQEHGLTFELRVGDDLPETIGLERISLERILSNILSNAIKYTDQGGVTMDVSLLADDTIRFQVEDTGPGFSSEALTRLFRYQGRGDRRKPGTGLGLHITREMADRLGAEVEVRNREDGGGVVTLLLPRGSWATLTPEPVQTAQLPDLAGRHVLLAEDSATNQMLVSRMLETMGAVVTLASDGIEALHLLDQRPFDLALIDIEMPRLTGIEVIRALRAMPDARGRTPVLAVTAYVLRGNRRAIYAAGADRILAKPISGLDIFAQAIGEVLPGGMPPPAEPRDEPFDRERFEQLLEIAGPEGRRELLTRLDADLRGVERGLVTGLADDNPIEIRTHSHVLIALAGAVGAESLQRRAEKVNRAAHLGNAAVIALLGKEVLDQLDVLIHALANEAQLSGVSL
ncbi:histidine kinase [Haematobacter missouriensis]|nr:ATP-binding protein [Haematobacter missouriensis]KFI33460.1 histidine kinase [Haematobacter missouriensis]